MQEVVGVHWDKFTVVGDMQQSQQLNFVTVTIPALQVQYEEQNLSLQCVTNGSFSWNLRVREFRLDDDENVAYGPVLLYMETVRHQDERVRLEFNPDEQTDLSNELKDYLLCLMINKSVTRADLAFDVYADLSTYRFNKSGFTSRMYLGRSSSLETLYVGAGGSDKQVRMYNKLKELSAHNKFYKLAELPELPEYWWRVELQMRRDISEDFVDAALDYLKTMHSVHGIDRNAVDPKDYALLVAFIEHPELLGQQTQYTRSKYRKMINEVVEPDDIVKQMEIVLTESAGRLVAERNKLIEQYEKS